MVYFELGARKGKKTKKLKNQIWKPQNKVNDWLNQR